MWLNFCKDLVASYTLLHHQNLFWIWTIISAFGTFPIVPQQLFAIPQGIRDSSIESQSSQIEICSHITSAILQTSH